MSSDVVADPPGYPIERQEYDLTVAAHHANRTDNGRTAKAKPEITHQRADTRSPEAFMRQLGFDPTENMSPLQFLMAVYNDRLDLIFKNVKRRARAESKGGISIAYRLEAAKTVAKYIHMEMPKMQINESEKDTFGKDLAEAAARGNDRIRTKRIILEAVERISPDIPLPPASYPPDFEEMIQGSVVREVQEEEGDTSYNPDDDD